ncbi:MAG: hypothetical protein ABI680_17160 [Chthoniobacteraceae bacterium]
MTKVLPSLILLAALTVSNAAVVRLAPDFSWPGAGNKNRSLRSLRGQSVVLLIADSPKNGKFRKQLKWLDEIYTSFAAKGVVFIAAFQQGEGPVRSDIPFVVATNGAAVANAYGVKDGFSLVVIGRDGNVDYQTDRVRTGERVRDVIQNSFAVQAPARKS